MSVVKRIIQDNIEKVKVDELLADEYEQAGYGGITLTKTPLGAQINLYAMRPGRVIGKRGRAIKDASERLENELGLSNPQITVVEVEVPELNPRIMAARIANALERGVHYRRAIFWSLRRTMESGALGCEILLKGKLRSDRGRYEKVVDGYIPKSGDPALRYVKSATIHVKQKKGTFGVTVTIVPPDAKFPDKVDLLGLPVIEYPEEEVELPEGVEPEALELASEAESEILKPIPIEEVTITTEPITTEPTESEVVEVEPRETMTPQDEKTMDEEGKENSVDTVNPPTLVDADKQQAEEIGEEKLGVIITKEAAEKKHETNVDEPEASKEGSKKEEKIEVEDVSKADDEEVKTTKTAAEVSSEDEKGEEA